MKAKLILTALLVGAVTAAAQPAGRVSFNSSWTFEKDGVSRQLDLPHDWGVEGTFEQVYPGETGKLAWWGSARYSKNLTVSADEQAAGTRFLLDVDGAMSDAKVWCNGELVTEWPYGYASFRADLTPFLKAGDNEVAITLNNLENSSRWYPGGGVYRNVWLVREAPVSVGHWGTFVTAKPSGRNGAEISLQITLESQVAPYSGTVRTQLLDGGRVLAEATSRETVVKAKLAQ